MNTSLLNRRMQYFSRRLFTLRIPLFLLLVAGVCGFIILRIQTLAKVPPAQEVVNSQTSAAKNPKIDQAIVDKITKLQDNSVSVRVLFDQARQNPFQE